MAHMFGARCSTELTGDITHVVAAKVCDPDPVIVNSIQLLLYLFFFISVGLLKLIWQEKEAGSISFG
jgi:hypothetical protein